VFIAGGHDQQNKVTGECEVLGQGLTAPMVVARQAHSLVQVQDSVFAFGGMGEQSTLLSSVERINLAASQPKWELIGNLPVACCNPGLLATSNGQVLILGGKTLAQSLSDVFLFDCKTLFTKVGSLQQPDAFSQTVGVYKAGRILLAGKQFVHSVSADYTKYGVHMEL
jgi:hypothetical protein